MANFAINNSSTPVGGNSQQTMTTTYKTLCAVAASTGAQVNPPTYTGLRRGKLYDILIGTNGTPADNYMEFDVVGATIATSLVWLGSLSSNSSNMVIDPSDPVVSAFTLNNSSVETNIVAIREPFYVGINQRASYRWVSAPGSEIVYPAVSSGTGGNGLALRARSGAYTGTATGTVLVQEQ